MATDRYREHKALNPFFDVVMKGLKGFVEGEHCHDAIADDANSSGRAAQGFDPRGRGSCRLAGY